MRNILNRFRALVKHFALRYINNDALLFDRQRRVNLIAWFSLLAAATGFFSHLLLRLYLFGLKPDPLQIWHEKTYFMTVMMALVGILVTVMWDNLTPDHRDYTNLSAMPVDPPTIFLAKSTSVLVFVGWGTLILNVFSTFIFSFYLTRQLNLHPFSIGATHLLTHFLAYLFVFFLIGCIQGIIRVLCNPKWYRHMSTFIQTAFLALFISILIWFPGVYPLLDSLKRDTSLLVYLFPPFWFVGWGETLMGRSDSTFSVYGHIIMIAFAVPVGIYLLSIPRFFRKHHKTRQVPRTVLRPSKLKTFLKKGFDALILRNPLERGSFYFSLKTLNRSRKHKMQLLTFVIIPTILIFIALTFLYLKFESGFFKTVNIYLIAMPLILVFFLVCGIRMTITHVVHPPANWIFVLNPREESNFFLSGVKKAFAFSIVLPPMLAFFFIYLYLWDIGAAAGHTFYCLACASFLMNLVFIHYSGIPFIDSPKKSNGRLSGFAFLIGFLGFSYLFSALGLYLLKNPAYYILFYFSLILVFLILKWIDFYYHRRLVFTYNRVLDRVMVHLEGDTTGKKIPH